MPSNRIRNLPTEYALDRIDFEIVGALQNNARLSNKELAAAVGLAPSSCLARVRRLVDSGVVRGFHSDIDPKSLGIGLQALVAIRLASHSSEPFTAFRRHVLTIEGVVALYQLAGADDFLVHVAARDADHLREIVLDRFSSRQEVTHLETSLIFAYDRQPSLPVYA